MALKQRQKDILKQLETFGGKSTTRQIADALDLSVNGVSQTLGALREYVTCLGGRSGDTRWKLKRVA